MKKIKPKVISNLAFHSVTAVFTGDVGTQV